MGTIYRGIDVLEIVFHIVAVSSSPTAPFTHVANVAAFLQHRTEAVQEGKL